ncbi:ABC transporter ATP-binding protein [Halorubellus sp. JP-L1]|uniref:ABC transporter ATP-binding protein n=1 Tax=Halorubellus sp. JP-L1 TaxID=2715753 RepID=UPI0014081A1A|nr:ABC transporter ATP-binding protein [Halorubellus sp. JP-L1]NHN43068.1 ABC transporter ATP-binding protein [Halorubellus sp. JP-L1]
MTAIRTDALTKRFGEDVLAVDGLDLAVDEGEVFGFLGPNGAGKSTTINTILGFLQPTSGSVDVLGMDVTEESLAIRRRIGLLPEGYEPYENLTGREHVQSAIHAKGASDDPDELLDRVGLAPDDARRAASEYSTGMAKRMSLAVALVGDPDLLILDEPSTGLDPDGVGLLREIIREEAARGASVFFCSHILEEVEKVCDRVGILNQGELVAVDTIENLRSEMGAGATVSVTLGAPPADLGVADLDDVRSVTVDDRRVDVEVSDATAKMRVLRHVDERATVRDVGIEEASLEALFDEFTSDAPAAARETAGDAGSEREQVAAADGGESA